MNIEELVKAISPYISQNIELRIAYVLFEYLNSVYKIPGHDTGALKELLVISLSLYIQSYTIQLPI